MSWTENGEALDRCYMVKAEPEKVVEYLKRTHHELMKEALGRFLPVHSKGRILSISEFRTLLDLDDGINQYIEEEIERLMETDERWE